MRIVELGDNSMVIMKDSEDPPWISVGSVYRNAVKKQGVLTVAPLEVNDHRVLDASEYICSGGRLVLFFKEDVRDIFHLHEKVDVYVRLATRRSKRH